MKIGNIKLKNNLILAPMAGVTDVGFRALCASYGADYCVTEMISAKALKHDSKKTENLLVTHKNEKILVAQVFGSDPQIMAYAVSHPVLEKFDIIDINMGCPAPKIVKNGEGSALMKNMPLAEQIIRACVQAAGGRPVTVKFRLGWDKNSIIAAEFAKMCERAGASAITVHARTKEQGYSGTADLEELKKVVQAVTIPVIGNGDVVSYETYAHMLNHCGCSAVMVGRAALGKPWLFAEILGKKKKIDIYAVIEKHIEILKKHYPEKFIVLHMRKHILWYLQNIKGAKTEKNKIVTAQTLQEVLSLTKQLIQSIC